MGRWQRGLGWLPVPCTLPAEPPWWQVTAVLSGDARRHWTSTRGHAGPGLGDKCCPRGAPGPVGVMGQEPSGLCGPDPQDPPARPPHSVPQPHPAVTEVTPQQKVTSLRARLGVLSGPRKGTSCSVFVKRREMAKCHSVEQGQLRRAQEGPSRRWWLRALPPRGSQGRLGLRGQVILLGLTLKLAGASHPGPRVGQWAGDPGDAGGNVTGGSRLWGSLHPDTCSLPSRGQKDSPELVHHPHQHEECVLAHTLLECVGERRELLVRGARVKETAILAGRGGDVKGRPPSSSSLPERTLGTWGGQRPVRGGRAGRGVSPHLFDPEDCS